MNKLKINTWFFFGISDHLIKMRIGKSILFGNDLGIILRIEYIIKDSISE